MQESVGDNAGALRPSQSFRPGIRLAVVIMTSGREMRRQSLHIASAGPISFNRKSEALHSNIVGSKRAAKRRVLYVIDHIHRSFASTLGYSRLHAIQCCCMNHRTLLLGYRGWHGPYQIAALDGARVTLGTCRRLVKLRSGCSSDRPFRKMWTAKGFRRTIQIHNNSIRSILSSVPTHSQLSGSRYQSIGNERGGAVERLL